MSIKLTYEEQIIPLSHGNVVAQASNGRLRTHYRGETVTAPTLEGLKATRPPARSSWSVPRGDSCPDEGPSPGLRA